MVSVQSLSQCLQSGNLYFNILRHCICFFIWQEMRAVTKSNWDFGVVPSTPRICEKKTKRHNLCFQFAWVEKWYAAWSEAEKIMEIELWKLAKYYRNKMGKIKFI